MGALGPKYAFLPHFNKKTGKMRQKGSKNASPKATSNTSTVK